jgi:hypothetical protein
MSTPSTSNFRVLSPKRRMMLAGLGAGMCAAVVGALRWPKTESAGNAEKSPVRPPRDSDAARISSAETDDDAPLTPTHWSREWFLPHLRSNFQMAGHPTLRLAEISPATGMQNGAISYTAFTLLFEGPANCDTPEGIHRLRHETLGEMDLFLSPVGRPGARPYYQAAFTLKS